ncbi:MAG: HAMP domain-containing histidine kinase [Candidatus Omnitrophica bacterium]|nr:HAMP domain-containing histidine kinase [Candidatus Omnitrophota bacterium]
MGRATTPDPSRALTPVGSSTQSLYQAVRRDLLSRFNIAFSLMTIIPLLTCCYLITVRFFSISVLEGLNGMYFLLALVIALLGLLAGRQLIRDVIRRLVEANVQLAQLNDRQAAFVGNVAHELRTPLTIFKGALDNLADGLHGPLAPEQQPQVSMCQKEVNRLARLVGDLLDVTRIEAGRLPLAREPVVLQEVLGAVGQLFSGLAKERGLQLSVQLPQQPVTLIGDRDRLQQVFVNLVANALKFTERGEIRLTLISDGDAVQVEVADTGPGIDPADRLRIFDKFERVGHTMEEGAGLGLPIARDLVDLHHGHIWVESQPGQGSRFVIRLPKTPEVPP